MAVLLEPSLQPGIEQQAVGRICRIGQERPTKCIRLIVEVSIEPNILLWQSRRLAQGCRSASGHAPLGLNDFVHVFGHQRGGADIAGAGDGGCDLKGDGVPHPLNKSHNQVAGRRVKYKWFGVVQVA